LIKVLHILDSLNRGGAEIMALDLCRNAKANGLNLTFVATGGGDLEADFRNSSTEFIRLARRLPVDLSLTSQLRRIVKEREIDVVHSHQPVEALHLYLATRRSQVKRVLTLHGAYPGTKNELALRFVIPRMDACIAVSSDVLELAGAQDIDTSAGFSVINNGVDPGRMLSGERTLRAELGLDDDAMLFGMVANFYADHRKDQFTICKALPRFLQHAPNARFVFVGSASESAQYLFNECVGFCRHAGIDDRVHFLGKRADIPDVLNSLDVFVLSSLREGSPISAIEAMMTGLPALLSDIAPLREVSDDGKYATLFRTGDADDLASKLIQLADNPEHRKALGLSARRWAMSQFSIESHIANLKKLYSSLVG
jgi:L-malate glycosyltransferase